MKIALATIAVLGATAVVLPSSAFAQTWTPGSEIVGQPVQVVADGVTNTVYFDTATTQRIVTPNNNSLAGSWAAANRQLCMIVNSIQECWPYTAPFQAGVPVTLTSLTSSKPSTWTALSVNPGAPSAGRKGERGQ
jgi:hypothetical protein